MEDRSTSGEPSLRKKITAAVIGAAVLGFAAWAGRKLYLMPQNKRKEVLTETAEIVLDPSVGEITVPLFFAGLGAIYGLFKTKKDDLAEQNHMLKKENAELKQRVPEHHANQPKESWAEEEISRSDSQFTHSR